ncbi:hypothetical protein DdX_10184 [Ditylenchus destructor]|uniref:Uncharacterized protein n=1 Tax=Ditylenchus destructor TaxID=166010 RepID=A0AAD4N326_9BILA|nr:hypothetical protein DdX_10184 [Ditylenchus destructor]
MEWNRTNTEWNQQPINVLIKSFASLFIGLWFCKGNRLWPKRQKKADGMKLASDGAEMALIRLNPGQLFKNSFHTCQTTPYHCHAFITPRHAVRKSISRASFPSSSFSRIAMGSK